MNLDLQPALDGVSPLVVDDGQLRARYAGQNRLVAGRDGGVWTESDRAGGAHRRGVRIAWRHAVGKIVSRPVDRGIVTGQPSQPAPCRGLINLIGVITAQECIVNVAIAGVLLYGDTPHP